MELGLKAWVRPAQSFGHISRPGDIFQPTLRGAVQRWARRNRPQVGRLIGSFKTFASSDLCGAEVSGVD